MDQSMGQGQLNAPEGVGRGVGVEACIHMSTFTMTHTNSLTSILSNFVLPQLVLYASVSVNLHVI